MNDDAQKKDHDFEGIEIKLANTIFLIGLIGLFANERWIVISKVASVMIFLFIFKDKKESWNVLDIFSISSVFSQDFDKNMSVFFNAWARTNYYFISVAALFFPVSFVCFIIWKFFLLYLSGY